MYVHRRRRQILFESVAFDVPPYSIDMDDTFIDHYLALNAEVEANNREIDRLKKRNSDIALQRREMADQARGTSHALAVVMISLAQYPAREVASKSSAQAFKRCVETTPGVSRIVRGESSRDIIVDIEPDARINDLAHLIGILRLSPEWTLYLGLSGTKMYDRHRVYYLPYLTKAPYCISRSITTDNGSDYHATAESVARHLASLIGLTL